MKYLVTGATGLLGNNVVRQLLGAGEKVRVLSRASSDPRPLAGLAVECITGDVRDADSVHRACQGVDIVVHAAGHVHVGWTQLDVHRQINVEGLRNVAAAAQQAGSRLVHVSSVNALGLGRLAEPADEETALPGIVECPYVITKREAEQVVLQAVDRGLWATIVNPSLMLGPYDWKPSSGEMMLQIAKFCLWAPQGASSFCDVRDVAAGTIAAAHQGMPGNRYILAGHNLTYREAWTQMAQIMGKRGPLLPMGPLFRVVATPVCALRYRLSGRETAANTAAMHLGRQSHCFSSRRAEQALGYTIRPFHETLVDTWDWFRQNGYIRR
jgi:dihydroflavonol-4-reductase